MSKINVSTITNRTGTSGPVLSGVTTTAVTHSNGAVTEALKLTTTGSYSSGNSSNAGPAISFGQFQGLYPTWTTAQVAGIRKGVNWHGALAFYTNNGSSETDISEKVRITSDGRVGVGTEEPGSPLEVNGGSALDVATFNSHHADGPLINVQRSGTAIGFVGSGKNLHATTGSADALALRSQAEFTIATGGATERFRINSAGKLVLPTGSPGIQFGSNDTGTNITSQTLDDYEEGTWTPLAVASGGGGTWATSEAFTAEYTKIGRQVTVNMFFSEIYYSGTPVGYLQIQGLPFTKKANSFVQGTCIITNVNYGTDAYVAVEPTSVTSTDTIVYFKVGINNSGGSDLQANLFSSTSATLRFTMTYNAAS